MTKVKPTNDLLFKKVFTSEGNEHILKNFIYDMTGVEFKSVRPLVPYHIDNFSEYLEDEPNIRLTEVDVLAKSYEGNYVSIEMQVYLRSYADKSKILQGNKLYSAIKTVYGIFITDYDLFYPEHSALDHFEIRHKKENYPLKEIKNAQLIEWIFFSLTNKNVSKENNTELWQNYFKARDLSTQAPEYIKEAEEIIDYHNLSQWESDIVETIKKRDIIQEADLSYAEKIGMEKGREEGIEEGIIKVITAW